MGQSLSLRLQFGSMVRSMSLAAAVWITIGAAVIGGVACLAASRLVHLSVRRSHHEVGIAVLNQLGVIYAVLLAFTYSDVRGEYDVAAQAINAECGSLHGLAILADTLPPDRRDPLEQAIASYLAAVIEQEWPSMAASRSGSPQALRAFQTLWRTVALMDAGDGRYAGVREQMSTLMVTAHQQRETRLFQAGLGMPAILWVVLISLAAAMVCFVAFCGMEHLVSQIALAAVFAAALALLLVVVRLLDHPFEGALQLPASDFQETLSRVRSVMSASVPASP
ncbi:MAG: DUF4239 domain-containing protein [Acetobacteraceae bacterium]|nr:DUF4239 domain-containing protein [Acetobacteraceae bacterium]